MMRAEPGGDRVVTDRVRIGLGQVPERELGRGRTPAHEGEVVGVGEAADERTPPQIPLVGLVEPGR